MICGVVNDAFTIVCCWGLEEGGCCGVVFGNVFKAWRGIQNLLHPHLELWCLVQCLVFSSPRLFLFLFSFVLFWQRKNHVSFPHTNEPLTRSANKARHNEKPRRLLCRVTTLSVESVEVLFELYRKSHSQSIVDGGKHLGSHSINAKWRTTYMTFR